MFSCLHRVAFGVLRRCTNERLSLTYSSDDPTMSTPQGTPCACGSSAACGTVGDASSTLCSACSRRERRRAAVDAERERLTAAVAEHVSSGGDPWSFRLDITLPATVASEATVAPSSHSVSGDGGHAADHVSATSRAEGDGVKLHRCVVRAVGESGDAERLATFGRCGLSAASRSSFGPCVALGTVMRTYILVVYQCPAVQ